MFHIRLLCRQNVFSRELALSYFFWFVKTRMERLKRRQLVSINSTRGGIATTYLLSGRPNKRYISGIFDALLTRGAPFSLRPFIQLSNFVVMAARQQQSDSTDLRADVQSCDQRTPTDTHLNSGSLVNIYQVHSQNLCPEICSNVH